jgi:hypothetical protein
VYTTLSHIGLAATGDMACYASPLRDSSLIGWGFIETPGYLGPNERLPRAGPVCGLSGATPTPATSEDRRSRATWREVHLTSLSWIFPRARHVCVVLPEPMPRSSPGRVTATALVAPNESLRLRGFVRRITLALPDCRSSLSGCGSIPRSFLPLFRLCSSSSNSHETATL